MWSLPAPALYSLFLLSVIIHTGHSATCSNTTSLSCKRSVNSMTGECQWNVCVCGQGYAPIRSGCGQTFDQPNIGPPPDRSREIVNGSLATLFCTETVTKITPSFGQTSWFKGGQHIFTAVGSNEYNFTANDDSDLGPYQCRLEAGELVSSLSQPLNLTFLNPTGRLVQFLRLSGLPTHATKGALVTPWCSSVPMGATTTIHDGDNGALIQLPIVVSDANKGKGYICSVHAPGVNPDPNDRSDIHNSGRAYLPSELSTDIPGLKITIGDGSSSIIYVTAGVNVTMKCDVSQPVGYDDHYFVYDASVMSYQWQDHNQQDIAGATTATYTVTVTDDLINAMKNFAPSFWCTASFNGQPRKSAQFNFDSSVQATDFPKPKLEISASKPLLGSRVYISLVEGFGQIQWTKDGEVIIREADSFLQLDNITDEDTGQYTISLARGPLLRKTSDPLTVPPLRPKPDKPTIVRMQTDSIGDDLYYTMSCNTDSVTEGMTYTWLVNGRPVVDGTKDSTIDKQRVPSDLLDGDFTCLVHFNGFSSEQSQPIKIVIHRQGQFCTSDEDCAGKETLSGKCTLERCDCAPGYHKTQYDCVSNNPHSGVPCQKDDECISPTFNGKCVDLHCQFSPGKVCSFDNRQQDCVGDGYTGQCMNSRCVCQRFYQESGQECVPVYSGPGMMCESDGDCPLTDGIRDKCTQHFCECQDGFKISGHGCSGAKALVTGGNTLILLLVLISLFLCM